MLVVHLVLGVVMATTGLLGIVGRKRIRARHQRRAPSGVVVNDPIVYLVLGVIICLAGLTQVAAGFGIGS
jgi:hypothetical protein